MAKVGYVPDLPVFYDYLTGQEIAEFVGQMHGLAKREARTRALDKAASGRGPGQRSLGGSISTGTSTRSLSSHRLSTTRSRGCWLGITWRGLWATFASEDQARATEREWPLGCARWASLLPASASLLALQEAVRRQQREVALHLEGSHILEMAVSIAQRRLSGLR